MTKAYMIGDKDLILGFQLAGIKGVSVSNRNEALNALKQAVNMKDIKIIFVSEEFSAQIHDEIDKIRSSSGAPLIVEMPRGSELPGESSSTQKLMQRILRIRV